MKLLLVDDNDNIRRIMRDLYSPYFNQIVECTDGTEAVELFPSLQPDWTVMDVAMKKMDGIEATETICRNEPSAKIILVSQHNEHELISMAGKSGAVAFVKKDDLTNVIEIIRSGIR